MPTIHVDAEVSAQELLKAVEQLNAADLESFFPTSWCCALVERLRPCLLAKPRYCSKSTKDCRNKSSDATRP